MASVNECETRALERRCVHCNGKSSGTVYSGEDYLRVLQGLRGGEAMTLARLVGPFFWSDAEMMHVRLCADCIARLGIEKVATGFTRASGSPNIMQPFSIHRGEVIPLDNVFDGGSTGGIAVPKVHSGAPNMTLTRCPGREYRPTHTTSS